MTPYTINDLPALASLTANDYIPVWDSEASGEPTYKIKVSDMIASIVLIASLLKQNDVVNDLTSTATDKPGSANMLRELNNKLTPDGGHSALNNKVRWIIMGKLCQVVIYGLAFADASQMAAAGIPAPKSGYVSIICGNSNQITGKIEYANGAWVGTQLAGSTYSNGYGASIYIIS